MARNVHTISDDMPEPQGSRLEPENPPTPVIKSEGKVAVTFLRKLLNGVSVETMLETVQSLNLTIHIFSTGEGKWGAHIKGHGTLNYHAGGANSPRMALVNAFADFFVHEQKDIHDYPNFGAKKEPTP